jgi:hypothetical protein
VDKRKIRLEFPNGETMWIERLPTHAVYVRAAAIVRLGSEFIELLCSKHETNLKKRLKPYMGGDYTIVYATAIVVESSST